MDLKYIIFEQYFSAQILLKFNNIYAANTLLCACYDCLKTIHGEAKLQGMNKFETYITEKTYSEEKNLYEEMKKENSNLTYEEFIKNEKLVKNLLVKEFYKDVKFNKDFSVNHEIYIKSKHGFSKEETLTSLNLTKQNVEQLELFIRFILIMLYKDDILEYKKSYL